MREIKFRVWDNRHEIMMKLSEVNLYSTIDIISNVFKDSLNVMQYTGLKDKNGVEIYEDDIVKTQVWTKIDENNSSGDWYIGEIIFRNGCFYGYFPKLEVMENLQFFRYEVIGNIYENPELLNDELKAE